MKNLVFDTTSLSHFARAERLDILRDLAAGYRCIMPIQVVQELMDGMAEYTGLAAAIGLTWMTVVDPTDLAELVAFTGYQREFGGKTNRHHGEAAVLALVKVNGGIALIDEQVATLAGRRNGLTVQGSLWLIIEGCRSGCLERPIAERLVDDLAATDMWLPCDGAGLYPWAYRNGLLP